MSERPTITLPERPAIVLAESDEFLDLADRVEQFLEAHRGEWFAPSQVGRKVHAETWQLRHVLDWMVEHRYADAEGNGTRTKYTDR